MKRKVIRLLAGFIIFMVICTAVSRGVYAWQMPQVKAGNAEKGTLSHKIEKEGVLKAASEKAVVIEEGLRIQEVCVTEGEAVKKGTVLLRLDADKLGEDKKRLSDEIQAEEQKLADLEKAQEKQERQVLTAKERARQDMKNTTSEQRKAVVKAKKAYQEACKELASYTDFETYLNGEKMRSAEYRTMEAAAGKPKAPQEDVEAFMIFSSVFREQALKEWKEGKDALEKAVSEKKSLLKSARDKAKKLKKEAKEQAAREIEDIDAAKEENTGGVYEQENLIREKEEQLRKLEKYAEEGGAIRSEEKGTVQKINVGEGEETAEGVVMTLAVSKNGWYFQTELSSEEREYVNVGDMVSLEFSAGKIRIPDAVINTIRRKGDGSFEVTVLVENEKLSLGENGTLKVEADSGTKDCLVPLSALYAGGNEYYVLVLEEKETFLGKEYSVSKRNVVVGEKNEQYAALENAPVGEKEQIVVLCDREVQSGDEVRMLEEDNEKDD